MAEHWSGTGTPEAAWKLKTPPHSSEYTTYRGDSADPTVLVCQVGGTTLTYVARAIDDLHAMLVKHGDWMLLLLEALDLVELEHSARNNRVRATEATR
ncbi:DUF6855 family protein [Agromyces sp. NPDC058484]|uniref:DUF6855 family protein n=1 Tax=Agromyces sp. NPDC058484 TaxID=3346524 RepID=UPI003664917E